MVSEKQNRIVITGMVRSGSTFLGATLSSMLPNFTYFREPGNSENYIKKGGLFNHIFGNREFNTIYVTKSSIETDMINRGVEALILYPTSLFKWSNVFSLRSYKYTYKLLMLKLVGKLILKDPTIPFIASNDLILSNCSVYFTIRHPHSFVLSIYNNYSTLEGLDIYEGLKEYFKGIEDLIENLDERVILCKYEDFIMDFNGFLQEHFNLKGTFRTVNKKTESLGWGHVRGKIIQSEIPSRTQVESYIGTSIDDLFDIKVWRKYYESSTFN